MLDGSAKLEPAAREALESLWTEACAAVMQLHAAGDAAAIPEALGAAKRLLDACGVDEAVAPRESNPPPSPSPLTTHHSPLTTQPSKPPPSPSP